MFVCIHANANLTLNESIPQETYITIHEGEIFSWSFNAEDFSDTEVLAEENQLFAQCYARIDNMQSNELLNISYYENDILETPFRETTVTFSGSPSEQFVEIELTSNPNVAWADRQGIIVFEALIGDMEISNYSATTIVDGNFHTASIPEPNSVALLMLGAGTLYLRRKRNSNQELEPTRRTPVKLGNL